MKFNRILSSMHRLNVDNALAEINFHGRVIDVGGRKADKRGQFLQPENQVEKWEYVNINPDNKPDYLCSAENIPVGDAIYDIALLSEVLEHLERPEGVIDEITRILRTGGILYITVPFMFHEHGSPYDFQRWTRFKIEKLFVEKGYKIESLKPLGGVISILYDNIKIYLSRESNRQPVIKKLLFKIINKLLQMFSNILYRMDCKVNKDYIASGFFIKVVKL